MSENIKKMNLFEKYLTLWCMLCMPVGIAIVKVLPQSLESLRSMEFGGGSQINIPIAILLWLMICSM